MQRQRSLSRRQQGIVPFFRPRTGVGGDATEGDIQLGGGHKIIAAANQFSGRDAGADMDGGKEIDVIHHASRNHRFRAARAFFGRLENKLNGAAQLRLKLLQHLSQPQAYRGVTIVAAGMHHARVAGGKPVGERAVFWCL